jgi:hypothetical protein
MPIDSQNNKKTASAVASLVPLLEQLREAKRKTHVEIKGLTISPLRRHKEAIAFDKGVQALEKLQSLAINSLQFVQRLDEVQQLFLYSGALSAYQLPNFRLVMDPELFIYADIDRQLDHLENKAKDLARRGYDSAANKANKSISYLRSLNRCYFEEKKIDNSKYKGIALRIINQCRPELAKHRGCKKILGNLSLLIGTLGMAFIVNKCLSGHYLFFQKTESAKQLDAISLSIKETTQIQRIKRSFNWNN